MSEFNEMERNTGWIDSTRSLYAVALSYLNSQKNRPSQFGSCQPAVHLLPTPTSLPFCFDHPPLWAKDVSELSFLLSHKILNISFYVCSCGHYLWTLKSKWIPFKLLSFWLNWHACWGISLALLNTHRELSTSSHTYIVGDSPNTITELALLQVFRTSLYGEFFSIHLRIHPLPFITYGFNCHSELNSPPAWPEGQLSVQRRTSQKYVLKTKELAYSQRIVRRVMMRRGSQIFEGDQNIDFRQSMGEDVRDSAPWELDSDRDIHYPKIPATSPTSESHNTGLRDSTGEGDLKSPLATPETLPPLSFHPPPQYLKTKTITITKAWIAPKKARCHTPLPYRSPRHLESSRFKDETTG